MFFLHYLLQFLDFILLVALRCPMFRGASSPVVKLSNLMLLLNQSQGKHKLAKKFRSKELVVFRVNPVFAMAASFSTTGHQSVSSSPMPVGSSGGSGGFSPAAAGFDGTSSHQDIPLDSVERHSVKNPTRSPSPTRRGGNNEIPIAPTTRPFKPSTVPFFDAATQAVVQIRRKKPMTELRGKLSDSY